MPSLYIDGAWTASADGICSPVVNPSDATLVTEVDVATDAQVQAAIAAARRAFDTTDWPRSPTAERAALLDERLSQDHVGECWQLRLRPGARFSSQAHTAGLPGQGAGWLASAALDGAGRRGVARLATRGEASLRPLVRPPRVFPFRFRQ